MANKILKAFDEVTGEIDQDEVIKLKEVSTKVEEQEIIDSIVDRFEKMEDHRRTSCPWGSPVQAFKIATEEGQDDGQLGYDVGAFPSDWATRWVRDIDLCTMKSSKNRFKGYLPDVSVPTTYNAVTAFINQYMDNDSSVNITAQAGGDKVYARIGKSYIEELEDDHIRDLKKQVIAREAAMCGTAITYQAYTIKKRKVKRILTPEEVMANIDPNQFITYDPLTGEQNNDGLIQEQLRIQAKIQNNPESVLVSEEIVIDYQGATMQHVPLVEFFVDPSALNLNGIMNDARDCVWRRELPVQQVINDFIYSDDPFVIKKNINKELLSSANTHQVDNLSKALKNQTTKQTSDDVELLQYYNKYEDQFIIVANRKTVIRKGPLPYNHKKLPFSRWLFIPLPNNFYGVGYGTLLDTTQQNMEYFQALQSYLTEFNNNAPIGAKGENTQTQLRELIESQDPIKGGKIINMEESDEIIPVTFGQVNFDLDKSKAQLEQNAVQITFINPSLAADPRADLAVRSAQMGQEAGLLAIRSIVQVFESSGYIDAVEQLLKIASQYEPQNYQEVEDEKFKTFKKQYRNIPLQGYEFQNGEISETAMRDTEGSSSLEITPEIAKELENLKVRIRVETNQVASKQLQAQQKNAMIMLAMQIYANPQLANNKMMLTLFKEYLDTQNVSDKVLSFFAEDENKDAENFAMSQNDEMEQGFTVSGIPGMTENHKLIHKQLLTEKLVELQEALKGKPTVDPNMQEMAMVDPMAQQMAMQQEQEVANAEANIANLVDLIQRLRDHIALDEQLPIDSTQASLTSADQTLQMAMPPMPMVGMPMSQGDASIQPQAPISPI